MLIFGHNNDYYIIIIGICFGCGNLPLMNSDLVITCSAFQNNIVIFFRNWIALMSCPKLFQLWEVYQGIHKHFKVIYQVGNDNGNKELMQQDWMSFIQVNLEWAWTNHFWLERACSYTSKESLATPNHYLMAFPAKFWSILDVIMAVQL